MNIIINVVITAVASTLLSVVTDIPIAFAVSSFCVILVLPMVLSHKDMTLVSKLCADAVVAIAGALWIWRTTFRKDLMLAFLLFLLIGNVAGFLRWKWSKTAKQE